MATLQSNLTGLNSGKRYQRPSWPADRWVLLKTPGSVEVVTVNELKAEWGAGETAVSKDLIKVVWLLPDDVEADDYSEEVAP